MNLFLMTASDIDKMSIKKTSKMKDAILLIEGKNQNTAIKPKVLGIFRAKQFLCQVNYYGPSAMDEPMLAVLVVDASDKKKPIYRLDLGRTLKGVKAVEKHLVDLRDDTVPGTEEGDVCNHNGCKGVLELKAVENCSCHIVAPCPACATVPLICSDCDWMEDDE